LVNYLVLGDDPHLVAEECSVCGASFFGRRTACASCSGTEFRAHRVSNDGILRTFTIVARSAPGISVPFIAGVVDCDGTLVRGNLINIDARPESIALGMKVRLKTYPFGTDEKGVEAIGFGYEPVG
jgi:uncharacterized OB-fold protein